jgi:hypothetical protein
MLGVPARSAVLTFRFLPLSRTNVSLWFWTALPALQFVSVFIVFLLTRVKASFVPFCY